MLQRRLLVKMTKIESFLSSPESFELATSLPPAFVRMTSNPTGIHLYNGPSGPGLPALCPIALAQELGLVPPSLASILPRFSSLAAKHGSGRRTGYGQSWGLPGTAGYCPRRNAWPQ